MSSSNTKDFYSTNGCIVNNQNLNLKNFMLGKVDQAL